MSLYADDLMLYHPIYSATDNHSLQMDIDNLSVWSDHNLLKFNGIENANIWSSPDESNPLYPLHLSNMFCKYFDTLATVPGLHPSTSGVRSTCITVYELPFLGDDGKDVAAFILSLY